MNKIMTKEEYDRIYGDTAWMDDYSGHQLRRDPREDYDVIDWPEDEY